MKEMKTEWENGTDDEKKILLFLLSRGFRDSYNKPTRLGDIRKMLKPGETRQRSLQVLKAEGDKDISADRHKHYVATCIVIHRYFLQEGTKGFATNMSDVTYYLREQKYGSCFLQAACVIIAYLLQAYGKNIPPPDGSKFIRHNFTDDQLYKYIVDDDGGDSIAMFRLLEKQFFDCDYPQRPYNMISCPGLMQARKVEVANASLDEGPGLVAKFKIPDNFSVDRKGSKKAGFARFTEWNKEAKFIVLEAPSDEVEKKEQKALAKKWKESCASPHPTFNLDSFDDLTIATASMSFGEASNVVRTNSDSCAGSFDETIDAEDYDEDPVEESCSDSGKDDDSDINSEAGEGAGAYHAMILLGSRIVKGEIFWVLQNSWSRMRIIEMSNDYLAQSGALLIFFEKIGRQVRDKPASLIQCCPSPVAESGPLERSDCEWWDEGLTFSENACLEDGGSGA